MFFSSHDNSLRAYAVRPFCKRLHLLLFKTFGYSLCVGIWTPSPSSTFSFLFGFFFLWMCGISNLYLSLKVFLWLLLFVKKVQYTYKTKPPENLFCEIKLHKAEWLTESAEGRLNCDKKNWKTQSSRLQMSQTFICWSLFVSVGGVLNYGIEKTSFVTLSLAVFWLKNKC